MRLNEVINFLQKQDQTLVLAEGFNNPHSYRGYYYELAFEPANDVSVADMLKCAKKANGATYEGYKGGEYKMGPKSDCYLAFEGCTGDMVSLQMLKYFISTATNRRADTPAVEVIKLIEGARDLATSFGVFTRLDAALSALKAGQP